MFQAVEIENFQSHRESVTELSPGINLIIGESDHGKSTIVRAIYWACRNRPSGDQFINWDNSNSITNVTIINDEHTVIRSIGKGINSYWIDDLDDDLTGFGRYGIPDVIQEALKTGDLNFQLQQDGFFLIGKSPPEVGRYINSIIDLDVIDMSLKHANSRSLSITSSRKGVEAEIENLKTELNEFEWLEEVEISISLLEKKDRDIALNKAKAMDLKNLIRECESCLLELERSKVLLSWEPDLNKLIQQNENIDKEVRKADKLESIISLLEKAESELKIQSKIIEHKQELLDLEELYSRLENSKKAKDELELWIESIYTTKVKKFGIQSELDQLEKEFHTLMPNICPLCEK